MHYRTMCGAGHSGPRTSPPAPLAPLLLAAKADASEALARCDALQGLLDDAENRARAADEKLAVALAEKIGESNAAAERESALVATHRQNIAQAVAERAEALARAEQDKVAALAAATTEARVALADAEQRAEAARCAAVAEAMAATSTSTGNGMYCFCDAVRSWAGLYVRGWSV